MKLCHICQNTHNHDYCPYCGAFDFCSRGKWVSINRENKRMGRGLRGMSIRDKALMVLAQISAGPKPVTPRLVKRSLGI